MSDSDTVIRVENLSKVYRIAHKGSRSDTLRDALAAAPRRWVRSLLGKTYTEADTLEEFWALKDVSFEVKRGEVVGIIGRNGAGKSTLLKILSRITEPTSGRIVLEGRVASLLEVGTGFHPELTGRENIFLNGSILGMSRAEIKRKFDEIVAFSEVEKFLDTPVKRYSSGMYVRLAFAVAAHLEPEILIVDEVLSVGDTGFQRKCLGKMQEVAKDGRTVLFVSHNLGAVNTLCTTAINLEFGRVLSAGPAAEQVRWYLARLSEQLTKRLAERTDREGDGLVRVATIELNGEAISGEPLEVVLRCRAITADAKVTTVALSCWTTDGVKVFHVDNSLTGDTVTIQGEDRTYVCRFSKLPLQPGHYLINVLLAGDGQARDHVYAAATLDVAPGDYYRIGQTAEGHGGLVWVEHSWKTL